VTPTRRRPRAAHPVPSPGETRPLLALRAPTAPGTAPALARVATAPPKPAPAPTTPPDRVREIAELAGALYSDEGLAPTVTFPGAPAAPTLARQVEAPAPTAEPQALAFPQPASAPAAAPAIDLDAVYEHVADRLRRDLLLDRERIGDLVGDLPSHRIPR
jgi:hypothetical protein